MATLPIEQAQQDVAGIFLSYFNRAPEYEAMAYYLGVYNELLAQQGDDPAAQPNAFKELAAGIYVDGVRHGEVPAGAAITNEFYVGFLYENVLGREPDPEGLAYWVAQLNDGMIERPELVALIINAAAADPRDGAYVANRTEVAIEFSQWENSNPNILSTLQYDAAEVVAGVDETPESVEAAQQLLFVNTGPAGETFVLTTSNDYADTESAFNGTNPVDFRFTDANEIIRSPDTTLNSADALLDASTEDHDELMARLESADAITTASGVTLQNIEHINLELGAGVAADQTFAMTNITGALTLTITGSIAGNGQVILSSLAGAGITDIDATDFSGGIVMQPGGAFTEALTITGGAGNNVLVGSDQDDTFETGDGDDTIQAGLGNNTITSGGGNDTITASNGDNEIDAGEGDDAITVGNGANNITAGAGNDTVSVGSGTNTIDLGDGDNSFTLGGGDNTVTGGAGADVGTAGAGNNTVDLGDGDNSFTAGNGDNTVSTGAGADTISLGNGDNVVETGAGADNITVGTGNNTITAGAGADLITLTPGGSNSIILGAGDSGVAAGTYDMITGFTPGQDTLTFGLGGGSDINTGTGAADTFDAALLAADTAFGGTAGMQYFIAEGAGGTWVFVDSDANGAADMSIELTGTTGFQATDIV